MSAPTTTPPTPAGRTATPAAWAEATATAQGLPPRVEDPAVLARVAALVAGSRGRDG